MKNGELHRVRARFESTGCHDKYESGKVIWRKLRADGKPSNTFAIQCVPNVPWAMGKWFGKMDGGWVLENFPQLKQETEKSKEMTDEEYIAYLHSRYEH